MKKLKKFESFNDSSIDFSIDRISPDDLSNTLKDLFSQNLDIETLTEKLREIKKSHPEVKIDLDLSEIWWKYIKKLYNKIK